LPRQTFLYIVTICFCFTSEELSSRNGISGLISPSASSSLSHVGPTEASCMTGKFEQLAGTIFQHCNEVLSHDFGDAYDVPQYPIAENQQKGQIVREITMR